MGKERHEGKGIEPAEESGREDFGILAGLPGPFLRWFRENARDLPWRKDKEPYRVWLSEIMLQQTRAEAVKEHYRRFLAALPDIASLAAAPEETVFKLWEGLGYYRRAQNLHRAAKRIVAEYGGVFPSDYKSILALPGIGEYTAGAVGSICFGIPKPAVDGNVLRVAARILDSRESVDRPGFKRAVSDALEAVMTGALAAEEAADSAAGAFDPGDFNQSLMELGATLCPPKGMPVCGQCPAKDFCRGCRSGRAELLPVRDVKKSRRCEERTVFILLWRGGEKLALCRRPEKGLLAGLWELPNTEGRMTPQEAMAQAAAWGTGPAVLEKVLERTHVFSHVEWRMTGYVIRCGGPEDRKAVAGNRETVADAGAAVSPDAATDSGATARRRDAGSREKELVWTTAEERQRAYPLPTAFQIFLQ